MSQGEYKVIEHLDFDLDDVVRCDGGKEVHEDGTLLSDRTMCANAAEYEAWRACCGTIERLCRDCYNWNCHREGEWTVICKFCHKERPIPAYSEVIPL